jgi:hypothetical protein
VVTIVLAAVLPIVVTFLLGFVASRRHDFQPKDAATLNRMVMLYAVPLALFAGTVTTSRAALLEDTPLVVALGVAIVGFYVLVFLLARVVFHQQTSISALAALTASAPAVPFVGPTVLGDLFGGISAIPIAVAGLIINLTVVPVTILLLALDQGRLASAHAPHRSIIAAKVGETVKEPIVWAPVLAFVIVLGGVHIPRIAVNSLSLLGNASGGVALFASGIVLSASKLKLNRYVVVLVLLKNVVQPAAVFGGVLWLGYPGPIGSEAVLTTAIPALALVIILALQYRVAQAEAASAIFFSLIGSPITIGMFFALTRT